MLVPRGRPKKITVPKTKTTLYHPLSKAPLKPGTVMDRWKVDEDWLIRKHGDTLADYLDIEPYELEFMQEWDRYFLPLHLSSELYFSPHYLAFVREKADWIVAKPQRAIEFSKSMAALHARAVIKDEHVKKALAILDDARARRKAKEDAGELGLEEGEEEKPVQQATLPKSEGAGCAKCGEFVLPGPSWLSCQGTVSAFLGTLFGNLTANKSGQDCPKPLWHDHCAAENGQEIGDKDNWKCNQCITNSLNQRLLSY